MTLEHAPSHELLAGLQERDFARIRQHLASYGFRDQLGHPLENCVDFLFLLERAIAPERDDG